MPYQMRSIRSLKPLGATVADDDGAAHFAVRPPLPSGTQVHLVALTAQEDGAEIHSNTVTLSQP